MWIPRLEHESSGLHYWVASTFICWAFLNYTLCTLMLVNLLAWNSPCFFFFFYCHYCGYPGARHSLSDDNIVFRDRTVGLTFPQLRIQLDCFTMRRKMLQCSQNVLRGSTFAALSLFSPHPHAHLATTSASVSCPRAHSCSVTPSPRVTQVSHGLFLCPAGLLLSFRVPLTQPFSISVSRPLAPMPCCCPISRLRWSDSHSTHHHLT